MIVSELIEDLAQQPQDAKVEFRVLLEQDDKNVICWRAGDHEVRVFQNAGSVVIAAGFSAFEGEEEKPCLTPSPASPSC